MPSSGSLSAHSPVRLYYLAAANELTGLLALELSDRTIEVHFRKGNPEHVGSSHIEDSLPGFLLKQGLATAEQIAQAESQLERFGGELVAALFGLGILNPGTAFRHLAERAQSLLLRGLIAEQGSFRFDARELPPHKVMPLGHKWGVLTELVRRIPAIELKRRLQPFADKAIMKSGGLVQVSELRLTPQETRVLPYIDGVRSLDQLCQAFPQDADHFIRMGFLLRELEAVSFSADPVKTAPPPPPPKQPVPGGSGPKPAASASGPKPAVGAARSGPTTSAGNLPPPAAQPKTATATAPPKPTPVPKVTAAAPPPAQLSHEQEIALLRSTLGKMREQNLFEVLGLTDKADANAVKIAYLKLAKTYHPDTLPSDAPAELAKLKADIFARIGEAYRTLSDDKARADYIEALETGGAQIDVAQILAAEEMFQKGCVLVKAKKFAEAVAMLDDAIKNNPEEGEFYAWRGYAKFFANADRSQGLAAALKDFDACLKKNPRCAQAYYFQGHIAKLVNDNSGAAKHFKKWNPENPQHIDAQRELRLMKK